MSKLVTVLLWMILGVSLSMLGDIFLKKSHLENYRFLLLGLFLYACGVIPVAILFKKIEFGVVFLIWEALTVILAMVIASLYFKEPFTVYKFIALLLAIGTIYFSYK